MQAFCGEETCLGLNALSGHRNIGAYCCSAVLAILNVETVLGGSWAVINRL